MLPTIQNILMKFKDNIIIYKAKIRYKSYQYKYGIRVIYLGFWYEINNLILSWEYILFCTHLLKSKLHY